MADFNENDCCGNGCANCVLNIKRKTSHTVERSGKKNILNKYATFLLISKCLHQPYTENVWELHFKSKCCNNNDFILDIDPGHHLMMRKFSADVGELQINENKVERDRKYILRPYSPFWWDKMEMEFKILVKLKANGAMSEYIKYLHINDKVEFRGPIGNFKREIDLNGNKCLLIISQGVAITSVMPIIEDILENENDMTRVIHCACFQNLKHVYFRDKLYGFCKYWNYRACLYLSKEVCNNTLCVKNSGCEETCSHFKSKLKYKEIIKPYRFSERELKTIVDNLSQRKENTNIVISGTGKFQNYYKEVCRSIHFGFLNNNIYLL